MNAAVPGTDVFSPTCATTKALTQDRTFRCVGPRACAFDMTNLVERVSEGNRVAVVASYSDAGHYEAVRFEPVLTVHGDSHIVWPVLEGEMGGDPPGVDDPPRPFFPSS